MQQRQKRNKEGRTDQAPRSFSLNGKKKEQPKTFINDQLVQNVLGKDAPPIKSVDLNLPLKGVPRNYEISYVEYEN